MYFIVDKDGFFWTGKSWNVFKSEAQMYHYWTAATLIQKRFNRMDPKPRILSVDEAKKIRKKYTKTLRDLIKS